jgi:lipoprotein-anchoring transpeptidase ErfK/SrfK
MNQDILKRLQANPKAVAYREPVTTPQARPQRKRSRAFWPLAALFGLSALFLLGWSAIRSPALAILLAASPASATAAATPQFWARAEIAKPTVLPPVVLPTQTPQEISIPENLNASMPVTMGAEIVPDTPAPEYDLPQADEPAAAYNGNKYILVDISDQHMYVYEGDQLVYSFIASTGMNNATRVGVFAVQSKISSAYGSTWDIWMPYWLGIYWAGGLENGIHALPILSNGGVLWEGFLGRPISYGCVVLGTHDAETLYHWADYGTPVEIQW